MTTIRLSVNTKSYNLIQQRKAIIYDKLKDSQLSPNQCGVNRLKGQTGVCGLDWKAYCFREMINLTEEPDLVPSHQVYFAGCNLKCGFCSVAEWNQGPMSVPTIKIDDLPGRIESRQEQGAGNLNLLGGEPAVSIYGILGVLEKIPPQTRVVWNSNMYYCSPVWDALDGLVDVYLADFKCGNNDCSQKMLGVSDYIEVVQENLLRASIRGELYIRHVVMPGHINCCGETVLEWIAEKIPNAKISLRFDYIPPIPAGSCPEGYVSDKEKQKILEIAKRLGLNVV
jgi:putative pyruvate formate lyase activating enzyme